MFGVTQRLQKVFLSEFLPLIVAREFLNISSASTLGLGKY
jgi:hypothetical protein